MVPLVLYLLALSYHDQLDAFAEVISAILPDTIPDGNNRYN